MFKNNKNFALWILPLCAIMGLSFGLFSSFRTPSSPRQSADIMPPLAPYEKNAAGIGVVEPKSGLISIGTSMSGIVKKIHVQAGETVPKGHPLFSLDHQDIDAKIHVLQAALVTSKAGYQKALANFNLVKCLLSKQAISQDDFNQRRYAKTLAQAEVHHTQAQLNQAYSTKKRLTIKAPIAGTILAINLHPGEHTSFIQEPLVYMGDLSTLYIRAEFDEENISRALEWTSAKAYKKGNASHTYPLKFIRFEPYIQPKKNLAGLNQRIDTRVAQAIYAIPQHTKNIMVGQQMDVYVQARDYESTQKDIDKQ